MTENAFVSVVGQMDEIFESIVHELDECLLANFLISLSKQLSIQNGATNAKHSEFEWCQRQEREALNIQCLLFD